MNVENELGQAATEYIIVVTVAALGLSFLVTALPDAISEYVRAFYFCYSRPYP